MVDLTVTGLSLQYGTSEVLDDISLTVPAGRVMAALGPSGSGKSALLRAVAGFETPHRGSIRVGEKVLYDAGTNINLPPEQRGLGIVLQSYALWPHRRVFDNVAYGLKLRRLHTSDIRTRVAGLLAQMGLAQLAQRYPHELPPWQQQRVAVARALIYQPDLLLLDEPLAGLNGKLREEARAWLRSLIASLNVSTLLATDDHVEAMAMADRVVLLNAGRIEQQGSPVDLYREPATLFTAEFMGNNNRLEGVLVEKTDKRAVIEVMGAKLEGIARTAAAPGERAIGLIRPDKVLLGGGPGQNRLLMTLKTQMYVGERWELVFMKDALTVRTFVTAPLKHQLYHVEFPPLALWIF